MLQAKASIIFTYEILEAFLLKSGTVQGCTLSQLLLTRGRHQKASKIAIILQVIRFYILNAKESAEKQL